MKHGLLFLLAALTAAPGPSSAAGPTKAPAAIVYTLSGAATQVGPTPSRHSIGLFDCLSAGAVLEVAPGARLSLAFASGKRWLLGGGARVTLGAKDLKSRIGDVRALPDVPTLPPLAPIREDDHAGTLAGAVRIRAERITGLYPRQGTAALAGAAVLRFAPADGGGKYRVEVQDRRGNVVFGAATAATEVSLPAGLLKPGLRYHWTVRTLERAGPVATGEADFATLAAKIAGQREKLRRAVESAGESAALALLAEVDRGLGLLAEARDELRTAIQSSPGDAALAKALEDLEQRLDGDGSAATGLLLEEVTPGSLGARAGLQAGDVLLSWCRTAASPADPCLAEGRFDAAFDFAAVDLEQAPRGGVRVSGKRGGASATWALLPGSQAVEVRPVLPEPLARLDQEGRSLAAERPDDAVERWRAAAAQARQTGANRLGVWLLSRGARVLAEAHQWPQADALSDEALDQARSLREEMIEAQLLKVWGRTFHDRGAWTKAEDLYRRSLELDHAAGRELAAAWVLHTLGDLEIRRSRRQEADLLLRQALTLHEKLAPRSSTLAASLLELGNLLRLQGDLTAAAEDMTRARSILEELAPESLETADAIASLGYLEKIKENLPAAEELFRRARAICERVRPESLEMARALHGLAQTAIARDDRETADYLLKRTLAIEETLDPSGFMVAGTLDSLGLQAFARKDLKKAEEYLLRAIDLNEKLDPDGLSVARNLQNLGVIVLRKGDCAAAKTHFQRAFTIRQKLKPGDLKVSSSLRSLGFLSLECGDPSQAAAYYLQALAIYDKIAPGGFSAAMTLQDLGEAYRRLGRSQAAMESMCRAADLEEVRMESSGRTETYDKRFFTNCLIARIDTGRTAEAFQDLERGRARIFLEQWAERDLLRSSDLPDELVRRKKQLAQEVESTQGALARLSSVQDSAEAERLLNALRELRDEQRILLLQIRKSSPRFASLQVPESLDLSGARRALDPGTVLLSYAVGEKKSYLFVVQSSAAKGRPGLSVYPLPAEKALREAVTPFRNLLQQGDSSRSELTSRARSLYALLVQPAEAQIAPAKRILVSADGPLHTLPFAALVRKGRYLAEWKPIHSVLSATVYAQLKKERRPKAGVAPGELVAFGNPAYPQLPASREPLWAAAPEVLSAIRSGLSLDPIPATRKEVESIAALYPLSRAYLGQDATEERVKSIGPHARLLHFACHGLLNERFPLDSALALTIPEHPAEGQDNGLLQAWEVIESIKLDADLVTLSACDTALGAEMSGEGLIGLTRAFQYAGARSVLASLWSVSDVSTGELMQRFYGHLRAGKAKDEALQAAQVALIHSRELSHPYSWAAFQLVGDWQ